MADAARYAKTEKGAEEISKRRKNLDRRMRTMLILVDPAKSAAELATQAVQLGVPPDFLQIMNPCRWSDSREPCGLTFRISTVCSSAGQ